VIGSHANGTTVHLHPGQKLVVRLAEQRTAGYNWRQVTGSGAHLSRPSRSFEPEPGAAPRPGAHAPNAVDGIAIFVFTAEHPGATRVQLDLYSPWHRHSTRHSFAVRVVVG
jgi:predicted secreted protein